MTGTPVQNRLEDLYAQTKFLRFQPFDDIFVFRKHILGPLGKLDERGLKSLRLIMKALAIRRTKGASGVSGRSEKLMPVGLSLTERSQYERIRDRAKQLLESSTSGASHPSHAILQTILQLRQLCSHGHSNVNPGLGVTNLPYNGTDSCNQCGIVILKASTLENSFSGQCGHRLCPDCYVQYTALYDGLSDFSAYACPICDRPSAATEDTMDWANFSHDTADIDIFGDSDLRKPPTTSSKISCVMTQVLEIDRSRRSDDSSEKR